MAEFAEANLQATVAQVEELERIGLLNKKEIKVLIEKRRETEYRLIKRSKNKADYINAVTFEKKLLELLHIRRKNIQMQEKYKEVEGAIKSRIAKRCRLMTSYWPTHQDVWAFRINVAYEIGWPAEVSIAYAEQVRFLGHIERVFIAWAKFEIEVRRNFDVARKILLSKAPLYHPNSILVRRELFRLELLFVESLKKTLKKDKAITEVIEENREKVLNCEVARVIYRQSVELMKDQQLYLELYQVADKFEFAHDLRDEIYRDMAEAFPNSEGFWKLKAQRTVKGLDDEEDAPKKLLIADKLNSALKVYDEALKAVGPSFFNTYAEELLLMLYEVWGTKHAKTISKKMLDLFKEYQPSLPLDSYIVWFLLIKRDPNSAQSLDSLLKDAVKAYPDSMPLQIEALKCLLKSEDQQEEMIRKHSDAAKGPLGIKVFEEIISHFKTDDKKNEEYLRASNSKDYVVAKAMRIMYLEWLNENKDLEDSRSVYKEYDMRPPLSPRLHATMILGELTKEGGDIDKARSVFEKAAIHCGKIQPGFWLSYIYFEKHAGDPLKAGALFTRAEEQLESKQAEIFRQLKVMAEETLRKSKSSKDHSPEESETGKSVWVSGDGAEEEPLEQKKPVVRLFEEDPLLTYNQDQERKAFFVGINSMKKPNKSGNSAESEDNRGWEDVLKHFLGEKLALNIHEVILKKPKKPKVDPKAKNASLLTQEGEKKSGSRYDLSDHLDLGDEGSRSKTSKSDLDKILEKSLTLKSEFMQQKQLDPYIVNKKAAKAERRKEREKTKGHGWYDMKKPEMTEELQRDLEVLQMRSILDPKRNFKDKDMKVLPKYFQMGKIVDSPIDFYSSRIPNKQRKRTMAEEILNDEEALKYQKRKYTEIIAKRQQNQTTHGSQGKKSKVRKISK